MATHNLPTTLRHQPIVSVDYESRDQSFGYGDVEYLSLGRSQWDNNHMSAKTIRWDDNNDKWAREADEMPLYRVLDLAILIIDTIYEADEAKTLLGQITRDDNDYKNLKDFIQQHSASYQQQLDCIYKMLTIDIRSIINVFHVRFKNYKKETLYNADNIYIYKIIPYEYLTPILLNDTIRLNQVSSWKDQNELFLFKQKYQHNGIPVEGLDGLSHRIFGQCWSLAMDCEAAWHAYGKDSECVRIVTTIGNLIRFFYTAPNDKLITYMGQVTYMNEQEMFNWHASNSPKLADPLTMNEVATDSLFIKRKEFSYEREFRIIQIYADNPRVVDGECVVDPYDKYKEIKNNRVSNLILSVEFDGRLDKTKYLERKKELEHALSEAGRSVKISRSKLYDAPEFGGVNSI